MSLGIAQQGFRDRLFVTAASGVDRAALPAVSVTSYLTETLHEGALEAAVVFRRATPNRKPILQMIDPLGRTTAFVKIGWNELTRDLVRNEGAILRRFTDDPPSSFSVPALRHAGPWQDLETLAVAPLPNRFWTRQIQATLPIEATREIALGEGEDRRDLATSPFRAKLLARLDLLGGNTSRVGSAVALLNDVVRSTGVDPFRFGRWHGDWAPWNMASSNGRLYVWDWERGGGPVPLGFDAIHFAFQTAMRDLAHDASASLDKADHASASVWSSLGLDEETRLATVALYLLEIYVRYEEANVRGASADDRLPDATLRVADQVIRRLV